MLLEEYTAKYRRFLTMEEIEAFPNYCPDVAAQKSDFKEGVGWYEFADEVHCGRRSCHRRHKFGFVVRLKDERVMHVGNDCGGGLFEDDFEKFKLKINDDRDRQAAAERLREFTQRLPMIEEAVASLRSGVLNLDSVGDALKDFIEAAPSFL